ncbi:HNH endonuclease [Ensifer sp. ENS11]|uniref:HNH endonuclease n=1 Tax=Ensifer sp. ENS11 TaxID=2769291 RepID=UPI001FEF95ED|nr:HNH endonuclease [Ensifer sp. ENS11]
MTNTSNNSLQYYKLPQICGESKKFHFREHKQRPQLIRARFQLKRGLTSRECPGLFKSAFRLVPRCRQPDCRSESESIRWRRPYLQPRSIRPTTTFRNSGGRSEAQAAHIRPVADGGPDSVRNGLALSGTVHWIFDRGLISVDDDYGLLIASGGVPDTITRLINPERRLLVPSRPDERPHSRFLQYHREHVFKG